MKKKVITALLTLALAISLFAATASALDVAAKVNGVSYETLQVAIDNATKGEKVTLLKDVTESVKVTSEVVLDLNGYKITAPEGKSSAIYAGKDANLTIMGNGKVYGNRFAVDAYDGAYVTINNGSFYTTESGVGAVLHANTRATIKVCDGYFYAAKEDAQVSKVIYSGANSDTLKYSEVVPGVGKIIIEGGYFDGRLSNSNWGQYSISGGTFTLPVFSNFKTIELDKDTVQSVTDWDEPLVEIDDADCYTVEHADGTRILASNCYTRDTAEGTQVVHSNSRWNRLEGFFSERNVFYVYIKSIIKAIGEILVKIDNGEFWQIKSF